MIDAIRCVLYACSGRGKHYPGASTIMTGKLLVIEMTSQLQSVGGGRQALAIPLTETQGLTSVLPSRLVPETDLKVLLPCKKPHVCSDCMHKVSLYMHIWVQCESTQRLEQVAVNAHLATAEVVTKGCIVKPLLCLRLVHKCTCRIPSRSYTPGPGHAWQRLPSHGKYYQWTQLSTETSYIPTASA